MLVALMNGTYKISLLVLCVVITACLAKAQSGGQDRRNPDDNGFTAYESLDGSVNSLGHVLELNSSLGYQFNRHTAADIGFPIYFVSTSASGTNSSPGLGNFYADLRLMFRNSVLNYRTTFAGYAPTGDSSRGFSTGRGTVDWTNHFDRSFSRLTPFFNIGFANTIPDFRYFLRPYTTLGFNTHLEGGADLDLSRFIQVGGSAYDIIPSGQQKVFSRLVERGHSGDQNSGGHGRVFNVQNETIGNADIAADHGFSTWIDASPGRGHLDFELGYTRSLRFDLNTVSFGIGVNMGKLIKGQ